MLKSYVQDIHHLVKHIFLSDHCFKNQMISPEQAAIK